MLFYTAFYYHFIKNYYYYLKKDPRSTYYYHVLKIMVKKGMSIYNGTLCPTFAETDHASDHCCAGCADCPERKHYSNVMIATKQVILADKVLEITNSPQ